MREKEKMRHALILCVGLTIGADVLATEQRLTLEQCIAASLRESELLRSSEAAVDAAHHNTNNTFWSFFPTASVSANYLKLFFEPEPEQITMPAIPGIPDLSSAFKIPEWSRTIDITVSQPVTPLWSVWKGYNISTLTIEIENLKRQSTAEQVKVKTAEYFYSYLMLDRIGTLLAETAKQLDRYYAQAQSFLDAGITDTRAVLKIKLEKAKLEKERQNVENTKLLIKRSLALLMNRPPESFDLGDEENEITLLTTNLDTLLAMQEKYRPEMRILERTERIAEDLTDISLQSFIPTVAATGGYRHNFDSSSFSPEGTFFVGGILSWSFGFDTMKHYTAFQKAKSEQIKTKLANIDLRKQMHLQVAHLHSDLLLKEKEILIAQAAMEVASENLRIEESKYREKITTETDLLAASLQDREAKTSYITAVFQYKTALWRLAGTIGVPVEELFVR